ncbi:MAG: FAD-binding protein [Desulfobacterales bacterium]
MATQKYESDVIIAGGGLAGIAAAIELLDHNCKVLVLERDTQENFGGLAKKSFGGIMFVDTPLQRKLGIRDNPELALSDWHQYADFGEKDILPKQWAKTYVERSRDLIYDWLTRRSIRFLPLVNWPERGLFRPGNSVPRWHIAWGTGYAITEALLHHLESIWRKIAHVCLQSSGGLNHPHQQLHAECAGIHEKNGARLKTWPMAEMLHPRRDLRLGI